MSDPVSNADIEDVLSSIRRLVSDEPLIDRGKETEEDDKSVERLVLTPAFRVHDDAGDETETEADSAEAPANVEEPLQLVIDSEVQIAEEYQAEAEWNESEAEVAPEVQTEADTQAPQSSQFEYSEDRHDDWSLEERIAELEAAIEQSPQEWEPDGSEDGLDDETRPLSFDTGDDGHGIAEALEDLDEADTELSVIDEQQEDAQDLAQPTDAAKSEDIDGLPEPPTTLRYGADNASDEHTADSMEIETPAADQDATELPSGDVVADEAAIVAEPVDSDEALPNDDDEALPDDDDEVLPDDDDEAAGLSDGNDPDLPIVEVTVESAGTQIEIDNILADDGAIMDEEALREMVTEIVRQELQGVLGEKITRNVRRLVRREIQRAMAVRDLE